MQYLFVRVDKSYALLRIMSVADWNYLTFPAARASGWSCARPCHDASCVASASLFYACRPIPRRNLSLLSSLASTDTTAFPETSAGRLCAHPFQGLHDAHSRRPVCSSSSNRTLYTEGFNRFINATIAPAATGRGKSCRMGFTPAEKQRSGAAHEILGLNRTTISPQMIETSRSASFTLATIAFKKHLTSNCFNTTYPHNPASLCFFGAIYGAGPITSLFSGSLLVSST